MRRDYPQSPPPRIISFDECLGLAVKNSVRLQLSALEQELNPPSPQEVFVSIDRVAGFKRWLDR